MGRRVARWLGTSVNVGTRVTRHGIRINCFGAWEKGFMSGEKQVGLAMMVSRSYGIGGLQEGIGFPRAVSSKVEPLNTWGCVRRI